MILNFFTSQLERHTGGIQNTSYYLVYGLSEKYIMNAYCTMGRNEQLKNPNLKLIAPKRGSAMLAMAGNFFKFSRDYRKHKYKKVVSLCTTWKYAIVPYFFRRNAKYIVMTHGAELLTEGMGNMTRRLMTNVLKNASVICSNSNYTASLVRNICPDKDIRVIHPLSGERFDSFKEGKPGVILSVGRLDERKGFQYVIEAVSRLVVEIPEICYYIAGDGEHKETLKKLVSDFNLTNNVRFLGRIDENRKAELLDEAMVMVMPSYIIKEQNNVEGFGIVYIEANAHGKPAIGTYSGGIPDAIINGETGILVEEKSVDQLTDAIRDILTGKKVFDKETCFEWAGKHYYTEIVNQYRQIIEEIK